MGIISELTSLGVSKQDAMFIDSICKGIMPAIQYVPKGSEVSALQGDDGKVLHRIIHSKLPEKKETISPFCSRKTYIINDLNDYVFAHSPTGKNSFTASLFRLVR